MANRVVRVVAAVIEKDGKYLITQRRDEAVLPRLWEFPGGRADAGELDQTALERELKERLGVEVVVAAKLAEQQQAYEGSAVHLALYDCEPPPIPFPPRRSGHYGPAPRHQALAVVPRRALLAPHVRRAALRRIRSLA